MYRVRMSDPISLLIKTYCLYSLLCFGKETEWTECAQECRCFLSNIDGIQQQSLICSSIKALSDAKFPNTKTTPINTLVLNIRDNNNLFQSDQYKLIENNNIAVQSLVLQGFKGTTKDNLASIFDLLDKSNVYHLMIVEWTNYPLHPDNPISFNFDLLEGFDSLKVLHFQSCTFEILDKSFQKHNFPDLHTLVITQSLLEYMDHHTFEGKSEQIRTLLLNNNQLTNLKFITSVTKPFQKLWHLNLSFNRLRFLPGNLISKLPNLRIFYIDGNNIKWFEWTSVRRLFPITEFRLAQALTDQSEQEILYLNSDMKWITELSELVSSSMGFYDSFLNGFKYCWEEGVLKLDEVIENKEKIASLKDSFIPDQVQIITDKQKSQLIKTYCVDSSYLKSIPVTVNGLELSIPGIDYGSMLKSRTLWKNLIPKASSDENEIVTLRLPLFDRDIYHYWLDPENNPMKPEQFLLIVDLVNEFLDLAYLEQQYVILVLWPSASQEKNIPNTFDLPSMDKIQHFQETVIEPLGEEIRKHPALIGIEITDRALQGTTKQDIDPEDIIHCPFEKEYLTTIKSEMAFIRVNVQMLRKSFADKLIGIGFEANCEPCLPLMLIEPCLEESHIDFITIKSSNQLKDSKYSHFNLEQHFEEWFQQNPKMNSPEKKRIFYSLSERVESHSLREVLKKFTMGYFISAQTDSRKPYH